MNRVRRWTKRFSKQNPGGVASDHIVDIPTKPIVNGSIGNNERNTSYCDDGSRNPSREASAPQHDLQPASPALVSGAQPAIGYASSSGYPHESSQTQRPQLQPARRDSMPVQLGGDGIQESPQHRSSRRNTTDFISNISHQVYPVPGLGFSFGPGMSRRASQPHGQQAESPEAQQPPVRGSSEQHTHRRLQKKHKFSSEMQPTRESPASTKPSEGGVSLGRASSGPVQTQRAPGQLQQVPVQGRPLLNQTYATPAPIHTRLELAQAPPPPILVQQEQQNQMQRQYFAQAQSRPAQSPYDARANMEPRWPHPVQNEDVWEQRRTSFTIKRPDSYYQQQQPRDEPNGRRSMSISMTEHALSQGADDGPNRRSFSLVRPQQRQESFRMLYGHEGRRPNPGPTYGWSPPMKGPAAPRQSTYPSYSRQLPPQNPRYSDHPFQRYPPGQNNQQINQHHNQHNNQHNTQLPRHGPRKFSHPDWRPDVRHHAATQGNPHQPSPSQPLPPSSASSRQSLPYSYDPLRTHPPKNGGRERPIVASTCSDVNYMSYSPTETLAPRPEISSLRESRVISTDESTLTTAQDASVATTASNDSSGRSSPQQVASQSSRPSHPPLSKMEIRPGIVRHNSQGSITRKPVPKSAATGVLIYRPPSSTVSLATTVGGASVTTDADTAREHTPSHTPMEKRDSKMDGASRYMHYPRVGVTLYDKPMDDDAIEQLEDLINRKLRHPPQDISPSTNNPEQEPFGSSSAEDIEVSEHENVDETSYTEASYANAQTALDPRMSVLSIDGGVSVKEALEPIRGHGRSMSEETYRAHPESGGPIRASSAEATVQSGVKLDSPADPVSPEETTPEPVSVFKTPSPLGPFTPSNGANTPNVLPPPGLSPGLSPLIPSPPEPSDGPYKLDYSRFYAQRDAIELSPVNLSSIMVHEARRIRLLEPPKHVVSSTDAFLTAAPAPPPSYLASIPFQPLDIAAREIRLVTILPPQTSTRANPPFPAANPLSVNSSHLHLTLEHVPLPTVTYNPHSQLNDPPVRSRHRMPLPPGILSPKSGTNPLLLLRANELNFRLQSYNWMSDQRRTVLHGKMFNMATSIDECFPGRDMSRTFEDAKDYLGSYVYTPLGQHGILHSDLDFLVLSYARDDDAPESSLRPVIVNGQEVLISPNLEASLRTLRELPDVEFGVRVWVESLCVNPRDAAENTVKAQCFVGDIVKASRHVISWVAPDDPAADPTATSDTDLAIDFINMCCERLQPGSWLSHAKTLKPMLRPWLENTEIARNPLYRALVRFFGRGYWRRAATMRDIARGDLARGWAVCGRRMVPTYHVALWAYVVSGIIMEAGLVDERRTLYHAVQSACAMCMLNSLDWTSIDSWNTETVLRSAMLTRDFLGAQEIATAQDLIKTQLSLLPPQISAHIPPAASTTAATSMPLAHAASLAFAIAKGAQCSDWITDVPFRWRWPSWVPRPGDRRTPPNKFRPRRTYMAGGARFPSVFEPVADVGPKGELQLELDMEAVYIGRIIRVGAYTQPDQLSYPRHHLYGGVAGLSDAVRACLNAKNRDPKETTFLDVPFRESIVDVLADSSDAWLGECAGVVELADRVTVAAASHSWDLWSHRLDALLAHDTTCKRRGQMSAAPDEIAALTKRWLAGDVDDGLPTLFALDSGHVGSVDFNGACLEEEDEGAMNADVDINILPGMELWVVAGCGWPVVLWDGGESERKRRKQWNEGEEFVEEGPRRFRCLGRAYVHGVMEGEALEKAIRETVRLV